MAIKVMHLQSNELAMAGLPGLPENEVQRLERQRLQNSPPQMAIMEAVVSSTMQHPNVSASKMLMASSSYHSGALSERKACQSARLSTKAVQAVAAILT